MSRSILVVDDAPDWREMLAGFIEDVYPKFKITTAPSMNEAKKHLTQQDFDLAIIDIRLDDSDEGNTEGLDLMEFIRKNYTKVQVLIVTGFANLETVKRAMRPDENGVRQATDYIEKDQIHAELLSKLSAIFEKL